MSSARSQIVDSLITELKNINGRSPYKTTVHKNVYKGVEFWDSINDFPAIYVSPGFEAREYLPGDFKWAFLTVNLRVFVKESDPQARLEKVISDIETVVDANNDLAFDTNNSSVDIRILSIDTDEGLLTPFGAGEIKLEVRYEVP